MTYLKLDKLYFKKTLLKGPKRCSPSKQNTLKIGNKVLKSPPTLIVSTYCFTVN